MIGFFLVVMFRLMERVVVSVQQLCDCFFNLRSQRETLLLSKLQSSKTYSEFEAIGKDLDVESALNCHSISIQITHYHYHSLTLYITANLVIDSEMEEYAQLYRG